MPKLKLGVMEFGYIDSEFSSIGKISDIIDYAILADKLGFSRFWLSEHHHYHSQSAWSNPQFLVPLLLNMTDNIKVGMAGILMNYYSPYEVAMNFKLIANVFPKRLDLGFANGTLPLNIGQLLCQRELSEHPKDFLSKVSLVSDIYNKEEEFSNNDRIIVPPYKGLIPDLYMLSSSTLKIDFCIKNRLQIAHSLFHTLEARQCLNKNLIQEFKEKYEEVHDVIPSIIIAVSGLCSAEGKNYLQERVSNQISYNNMLMGSADQIIYELSLMKEMYCIDEFVFLDCNKDIERKKETLYMLNDKLN